MDRRLCILHRTPKTMKDPFKLGILKRFQTSDRFIKSVSRMNDDRHVPLQGPAHLFDKHQILLLLKGRIMVPIDPDLPYRTELSFVEPAFHDVQLLLVVLLYITRMQTYGRKAMLRILSL